jgi:phosphoribosylglycinamide formyltransferase 1
LLINLLVDLTSAPIDGDAARARIAADGMHVEVTSIVDERVLAWIDETFGGAWSSEAASGTNVVAMRDDRPVAFATVGAHGFDYAWLRGIAREPGIGLFGPFGVAPQERGGTLGPSVLAIALEELRRAGHRRALIAATNERLAPYYERYAHARIAERFEQRDLTPAPVRTVVLASGSGSNFQAVVERVREGLPLELVGLVSNKSNAYALERAAKAGVPAISLPWKRSEDSREAYDRCLLERVRALEPQLVLLLGWMHLLAPSFVEAFPAMLNVHPAFLPLDPASDVVTLPDGSRMPAFRGAHAVADAIAAGTSWTGASVHEVTTQTDRGGIMTRKPMRMHPGEDEATVLERLHPIEHRVVEQAIRRWLYQRPSVSHL